MLTGWSCDRPHSIFTLQDSPLVFHIKQSRLTDANDSFVSYVDWLTDDVASLQQHVSFSG